MSSSRRTEPPGLLTRFRSPRTWSLRVRLLVTQVALLAVVCAGIGIATEFALQRFLLHQLDQQLIEAGRRSAAIFAFGPPPPPGFGRHMGPPGAPFDAPPPPDFPRRMIIREDEGPGPEFLNAPGQATRMVGAVIAQGVPVDAGVITADGGRAGDRKSVVRERV